MKAKKPRKKAKPRPPANRRKTGGKTLKNGLDPKVGEATRFKPGKSGNPSGRPKSKPITDAIEAAIAEDPKLAKSIAKEALRQAARHLGWFQEVRDMLDGKPDGTATGSPDDPVNLNLNVNFVDAVQGKLT